VIINCFSIYAKSFKYLSIQTINSTLNVLFIVWIDKYDVLFIVWIDKYDVLFIVWIDKYLNDFA
jgi:hypothetical protein